MKRVARSQRKKLSLYRKTLLLMMLVILIVFSVLALVHFLIFNWSARETQKDQLLLSSAALADRIGEYFDADYLELHSRQARSDMMFAARSSDAIVWLINSRGEIIFSSAFPRSSAEQLKQNAQGHYLLPTAYLNKDHFRGRAMTMDGNYHRLLPENERWISVSTAFNSTIGAYAGEVLMHRRVLPQSFRHFFLSNSIIGAFSIAFILAVLLIVLASHNITRPIAELVRTAEAVYRGDLSARATLGENLILELDETEESKDDDLTLLVKTMNTLISKLERQELERRDFLSSISHDLRSPITSIKGFVDGLLDGVIPKEKSGEYLEIVRLESERLQKLVQALFEISFLDEPNHLRKSVFDLSELAQKAMKALAPSFQEKNLQALFRCGEQKKQQESWMVVADADLIERALNNILINAVRFTPIGGKVRLSLRAFPRAGEIELSVEDSGGGIPVKDLPYVFDRFFKGNRARGSQGSGLGLYIARSILNRHDQQIEACRSVELGGACLRFRLTTPEGLSR